MAKKKTRLAWLLGGCSTETMRARTHPDHLLLEACAGTLTDPQHGQSIELSERAWLTGSAGLVSLAHSRRYLAVSIAGSRRLMSVTHRLG